MDSLVSIIVPVYNAEKYLNECLDSILNQTYKNIEIICVDDGSTDSSRAIIKSYASHDVRVRLIEQVRSYAGVARNNGMQVAKGKYIIFLDADDFFALDLVQKLCEQANRTLADIVICNSQAYDEQREKHYCLQGALNKDYLPDKEVFSKDDIPDTIFQLTSGWAWDKLYRLDFIREKKIMFQATRVANDQLFVDIAFAEAKKIAVWDEILVNHRTNVMTSLEHTRYQWWKCSFEMLYAEQEQLQQRKLYERLEKSFINRAAQYLVWYACTLKELGCFREFYEYMKQQGIHKLHLLRYGKEYFYNEFLYNKIREIEDYSAEEFLINRINELNDNSAEIGKYVEELNGYINELNGYINQVNRKKKWYLPEDKLKSGADIIIYGYGEVGRDFCLQICNSKNFNLITVVDQKVGKCTDEGIKIEKIENIALHKYDYIVIAVMSESTALQIRNNLVAIGVEEKKIVWFDLS